MSQLFNYDSHFLKTRGAVTVPHGLADWQKGNSTFRTESGTLKPDTSYPSGGYAVSPPHFGLPSVSGVLFSNPPGYICYYNATTDKIQIYDEGSGAGAFAEVANATNLSTLQGIYFEAKGQ